MGNACASSGRAGDVTSPKKRGRKPGKTKANADPEAPTRRTRRPKPAGPRILTIAFCRDVPSDVLARRVAEYRTPLVALRLEGVPLGDAGARHVARALVYGPHAASLRGLSVAHCRVGTSGCVALARALLETGVLSLDLSANAIRADGVKALVGAIRSRRAWGPPGGRVELRLGENPLVLTPPHVGVAALAELASCLRCVPRAKALALSRVGLRRRRNQSRGKTARPGYLPTPLPRPNRTRFP
jgi:hypothetical protein